MPAPIISGVLTFIGEQLAVSVYDGEVPRYDVNGNPINPASTVSPDDWPVVKARMTEGGFSRTWTMADPYDDKGELVVEIWGTTRAQEESTLNDVESLLVKDENWAAIALGGPTANPYYVISMLLTSWTSVQEEGVRTSKGSLLYRGELHFDVEIHGAISTTN